MNSDQIAQLAYLGLILAALLAWVGVEYRKRLGHAARSLAAWALIFVGAVAAYGLWNDLGRSLVPIQQTRGDGSVEIPKSPDGHYYAVLRSGDRAVRFMIDTGASNVVLTAEDAQKLGIDPAKLAYLGQAETANGTVRIARTSLPELTLGPFSVKNPSVWVNDGEMPASLLGMDFLKRFRITLSGDRMILEN